MLINLLLGQGGGKGEPLVPPVISDRLEVVVVNRVRVIEKVSRLIKEEGFAIGEGDRSKVEGVITPVIFVVRC
jgi:hypothetical protein